MATVAEFTARAENTPLGAVLAELPGETLEVERVKALGDSFAVYFWIPDLATDSVESKLAEQDVFCSVEVIDSLGGDHLFRADWDPDRDGILCGICDTAVILESARLSAGEWSLRLRSESPDQLSAFQNYCLEQGFGVTMSRFPTLVQVFGDQEYNLSDEQRAGLAVAYEEGYFEEPRETTLEELAESLDITPEAVLARIRKGERNLIERTVVRSVNEIS